MKNIVIFMLLALMAACSSEREVTPEESQEHKALYNMVNPPLEKAKGVEEMVLENAEQQRNQIDGQ